MAAASPRVVVRHILAAAALFVVLLAAPATWGQSIEDKYGFGTLSTENRQQLAGQEATATDLELARQYDLRVRELDLERAKSENEQERLYVIVLAVMSGVSLILVLIFVYKTEHTARDLVNGSGLTLIIYGTIILVILVDTDEQLTGGIGILGAIAGYLFGTLQQRTQGTTSGGGGGGASGSTAPPGPGAGSDRPSHSP
jgi:hypothetical protein